jgi:dipeptidyl aminopeptidase/acylaminoacyl peptidase
MWRRTSWDSAANTHSISSSRGGGSATSVDTRERSPIFHTDTLRTPLILFQGREDKIVPPNQAEMMAAALHDKGIPHALVLYEGEQHGFRNAENITRTAELELEFFGQVLGFEPADDIEGLQIENWHPT